MATAADLGGVMSDATWTPRTAREREAVVGLCSSAIKEWKSTGIWTSELDAAEAIVPPVSAPATRLREVVVGDGMKLRWNVSLGPRAEYYTFDQWREANHTQILLYADVIDDLRKRPTEPAPDPVVEAIREWVNTPSIHLLIEEAERLAATVRALVRAEGEGEQTAWSEQALEDVVRSAVREWQNTAHKTGADYSECVANAVRAAGFSQQTTPPLTVTEHVAALVGMGARVYSNIADDEMRFAGRRDLVLLPPEAP